MSNVANALTDNDSQKRKSVNISLNYDQISSVVFMRHNNEMCNLCRRESVTEAVELVAVNHRQLLEDQPSSYNHEDGNETLELLCCKTLHQL